MRNIHHITTRIYANPTMTQHHVYMGFIKRRIGKITRERWESRYYIVKLSPHKDLKECRDILQGQEFSGWSQAEDAIIKTFNEHYKGGQ